MAGAGVILEPLLCKIGDIEMKFDDEQMPPPFLSGNFCVEPLTTWNGLIRIVPGKTRLDWDGKNLLTGATFGSFQCQWARRGFATSVSSMAKLQTDPTRFDFCWSSCELEHKKGFLLSGAEQFWEYLGV